MSKVITLQRRPGLSIGNKALPWVDGFDRADGGLGTEWTGSSWTISSNAATNTPALGAELLSDPGLEANYTAGACDTFTKAGTPTVAQSADVHGGSKAQEFTPTALNDSLYLTYAPGAPGLGKWYEYSIYAKRMAGTQSVNSIKASIWQPTGDNPIQRIIDSSYGEHVITLRSMSSAQSFYVYGVLQASSSSGYDTVIVDDMSLKPITLSSLFATRLFNSADTTLRVLISDMNGKEYPLYAENSGQVAGLALNVDDPSNPANFVVVWHDGLTIHVEKCVAGVWTRVTNYNSLWRSGSYLQVVKSGTTYSIYYDGDLLVSTTISDAGIVNNKYHGLFASRGVKLDRFLYHVAGLPTYQGVYYGTSIVYGASVNNFAALNRAFMQNTKASYLLLGENSAKSGRNTWNGLCRLTADLVAYAPSYIVFDAANDGNNTKDKASLEAFIRRVRTALPNCRMFAVRTTNADTWITSTCEAYDVVMTDWRAWLDAEIAAGRHTLDDYYTAPDYVHPDDRGSASIEAFLEPAMAADLVLTGQQWSGDLDDYTRIFADSADYEQTPTLVDGTDYDARTGTWSDSGTQITSSEADATVTFHATCRSFGLWRSDLGTNPTVAVSMDGGAYSNFAPTDNGYEIGSSRAAHTFVIKVLSGTLVIGQFWAI